MIAEGGVWKGRLKGIVDLQIHWVLGHVNFASNKKLMKKRRKLLKESLAMLSPFQIFSGKAYHLVSQLSGKVTPTSLRNNGSAGGSCLPEKNY